MDNGEIRKRDGEIERDLRRRAPGALKRLVESIQNEPSMIVIEGAAAVDADCPVDDITEWLFDRRQHDGRSGS